MLKNRYLSSKSVSFILILFSCYLTLFGQQKEFESIRLNASLVYGDYIDLQTGINKSVTEKLNVNIGIEIGTKVFFSLNSKTRIGTGFSYRNENYNHTVKNVLIQSNGFVDFDNKISINYIGIPIIAEFSPFTKKRFSVWGEVLYLTSFLKKDDITISAPNLEEFWNAKDPSFFQKNIFIPKLGTSYLLYKRNMLNVYAYGSIGLKLSKDEFELLVLNKLTSAKQIQINLGISASHPF